MNDINPQLALFDLDGTLFDTEKANHIAYDTACRKVCSISLTESFFHTKCMSRNYRDFLPLAGIPDDKLKEVHDLKKSIYPDCISYIRKNEQLFTIALGLKEGGTKLCLVTTASEKNTFDILDHFGCRDVFDLIITQETVPDLKPSPAAYLYAMNYYSADPAKCIVFEDSDLGVEAAMNSGASVMRIERF